MSTASPEPDLPANPQDLLSLATRAAQSAVTYLVNVVGSTHEAATKSSRTDLVTESDRHVERLLVEMISSERPADGFLGEEGAQRTSSSGITWVIDPIDGTTNFFYGLAGFNVSIAAQCDEGALAAVVADPLHQDLYQATRGGGATLNGTQIRCSSQVDLSLALVATGFGYAPETRAEQARILTGVLPKVRDIRRFGAAAVDLCLVASGRVDAYFERGLAPWDHAAGALIASEAGARVADFEGNEPSSDLVIAAPPALWDPLHDLLAEAGENVAGSVS